MLQKFSCSLLLKEAPASKTGLVSPEPGCLHAFCHRLVKAGQSQANFSSVAPSLSQGERIKKKKGKKGL